MYAKQMQAAAVTDEDDMTQSQPVGLEPDEDQGAVGGTLPSHEVLLQKSNLKKSLILVY